MPEPVVFIICYLVGFVFGAMAYKDIYSQTKEAVKKEIVPWTI